MYTSNRDQYEVMDERKNRARLLYAMGRIELHQALGYIDTWWDIPIQDLSTTMKKVLRLIILEDLLFLPGVDYKYPKGQPSIDFSAVD